MLVIDALAIGGGTKEVLGATGTNDPPFGAGTKEPPCGVPGGGTQEATMAGTGTDAAPENKAQPAGGGTNEPPCGGGTNELLFGYTDCAHHCIFCCSSWAQA